MGLRLRCWIHLIGGRKPQRLGGRACVWTCLVFAFLFLKYFVWFEKSLVRIALVNPIRFSRLVDLLT